MLVKANVRKRILLSVVFAITASLLQVIYPQAFTPKATAAEVDTSTQGFVFDISLAPSRATGTQWRLYLSPTETGTATIDWPSSADTTVSLVGGTVSNTTVAEIDRVASSASGEQNKNIKITSTSLISVYGCWVQTSASDCTIFYPTGTWGTKYRPLYSAANAGPQIVSIVTGNSEARVSLTSPRNITALPDNFTAGTPKNITIPANRSYIFSTSSGEFSGTVITSDVPISVLNGAECINFGNALFPGVSGYCDLASQSVPPVSAWGNNYYSVNYRNQGATGSGYRILADQDNTVITISGDTTGLTSTSYSLNAGEIATFRVFADTGSSPNKSLAFTSNNPILIGHYMLPGTYSGLSGSTTGDPSMSYLTPFEQFLNSYTFASPPDLVIANLNIVAPVGAVGNIKLDGTTIASDQFRQIAGSTWRSAQLVISTGTHRISAPQAFGIEVYGAGNADSYAYTGGANTSPLANVASLQLSALNVNGVVGQSVCVPVEVLDASSTAVLGIRVDATISGVSGSSSTSATSDSRGIANFCSTGTTAGVDNYSFVANGFTASGTITWALALPDISYTPNSVQLATGEAMRTLSPTNAGGLAATWSISPSLPSGLSISSSTGAITGTPAADFTNTTYTVTATNASGSDTATIDLASATAVVASISYSPSSVSITLDTSSTQTPTVSGTFPTWSISPSLPTGLSINAQNGVISGTPTRTAAAANYTVTATNSAGSVTAVINLAVVPTAPNISHEPTTYSLYKDVAASTIAPRNAGSPATSWTISPTLPAGLAFNPTNGNISGTPTASSTAANYTITATNSTGSDTSVISIGVLVSVPAPVIAYSPSTISGEETVVISSLTPTNTGGTSNSWTISPSLPAGLSFNSATGRISGTPNAVSASATYTVTATNAGGSSTATLTIAVGAAGSSSTAQTITFAQSASKFVGESFASSATASSGLTVTLTSSTTGICTVSGLNITTVADGTCTIVASQNGGASGGTTYSAATSVTRSFTVTVRPATVTILAYRIDWNTNTGYGYMNPQYAYTGSTVALEPNLYKKDGFTFAGWNTKADGTGTSYADRGLIKVDSVDLMLYAQWKLIQTKPSITWSTPIAIQEETPLGATQLNASSEVAGTYTYLPAIATVLSIGKHTLKVTFIPIDPKFETVELTVDIEVLPKAKVTWANPNSITEGTALSGAQLNAAASIPGTFTYSPAAGTQLAVGKNALKVTFTPTDSRLSAVTAEVSIDVTAVIPTSPGSPTYAVTGAPKTTITWSAGNDAATYNVLVDGMSTCAVAVLTCDVAKLLGPKNVVTVTSVATSGKTSDAISASYAAPTSPQVLTVVNFDSARAVIKSAEAIKLRAFASTIKAAGYTSLTVYGHTDSVGGVDNQKLSVARANAAITYLKKLLPGVKFVVSGFAASEPVGDNSTAEGKAANRRAEIFIP